MAWEDQIPTIVATVGAIIAIGWYAIRDNRERMDRLAKETCQLRDWIKEALTEMYDKFDKHDQQDQTYFHEIFGKLAEMKGRDMERERGKGAV